MCSANAAVVTLLVQCELCIVSAFTGIFVMLARTERDVAPEIFFQSSGTNNNHAAIAYA
jgi:hypothetical protein